METEGDYRLQGASAKEQREGIGWAIKQMHNGKAVARAGWGEHWLKLQPFDGKHAAFIYTNPQPSLLVPWVATQEDLLAVDYQIYVGSSDGDAIVWGS